MNEIIEDIEKIGEKELVVVMLIGQSGSGKTHFKETYLDEYLSINYNASKDLDECKKLFEIYKDDLTKPKPKYKGIVVDLPNLDLSSRKSWFEFLKFYNNLSGQIIGIYFNLHSSQCLHNIYFRSFFITKCGLKKYTKLYPKFDLIRESSQLIVPTLSEGFKSIYELGFVPNFDLNSDLKDVYYNFINAKP